MNGSAPKEKLKLPLETFIAVNVEEVDEDCKTPKDTVVLVAADDQLKRSLSFRQVSMIAIAGVIGTGLFLGTGKSLATAGPASMFICYTIMGVLVYLTMLALGEMNTYMPVAGSFCTFSSRFIDPAVGFALTWNYWFNDAVSMASDLTALQLVFKYWSSDFPAWAVALIFWVFLFLINVVNVKAYGEIEYWLALLKVMTIVIFLILGMVVNCGGNTDKQYLGFHYWDIESAPFVNGFKGFAAIFVTAAFAYGGTESIGITAGETENPHKTMPRVVRAVFWRILIFYVLAVFIIGIDVPYTYPGLNTKSAATSPFTIVFQSAGSKAAGSLINAVIITAVLSAGNHALYAGSRLMYTLAKQGHAPRFLGKLTKKNKIPYVALIITWLISGLCFGSSFIGAGELWSWLQNLVGVSNQICWLFIGISSLRFRKAMKAQDKEQRLTFRNWTYPWGPWTVAVGSLFIILVQGWTAFSPWDTSTFFSYYIELLVMPVMIFAWKFIKQTKIVRLLDMNLDSDVYVETGKDLKQNAYEQSLKGWRKWAFTVKTLFV